MVSKDRVELESPRETLHRFRSALAADPAVRNVFVGGSIARGDDDEVSDLDLWIEGDEWKPESLGGLFLVADLTELAGIPFLHGVATGGTIIDILIGKPSWDGYRLLGAWAPDPAKPAQLPKGGLVEEFWSLSLKHRKNLWRDRPGMLVFGLHYDRQFLLRAWASEATGEDPGGSVFSLFGMKEMYGKVLDVRRLELLGLPLRSLEEILYAVHAYRDEMSRVFPNPTRLESTVRALPLTRGD